MAKVSGYYDHLAAHISTILAQWVDNLERWKVESTEEGLVWGCAWFRMVRCYFELGCCGWYPQVIVFVSKSKLLKAHTETKGRIQCHNNTQSTPEFVAEDSAAEGQRHAKDAITSERQMGSDQRLSRMDKNVFLQDNLISGFWCSCIKQG